MKFLFSALQVDRPTLYTRVDALLGIVATFSIEIRGRISLREELFPVVERAVALERWLRNCEQSGARDFRYESLESAYEALLEFLCTEQGCRLKSPLQEFEAEPVATEAIRQAAASFVREIQQAVLLQRGIDITGWVPPSGVN